MIHTTPTNVFHLPANLVRAVQLSHHFRRRGGGWGELTPQKRKHVSFVCTSILQHCNLWKGSSKVLRAVNLCLNTMMYPYTFGCNAWFDRHTARNCALSSLFIQPPFFFLKTLSQSPQLIFLNIFNRHSSAILAWLRKLMVPSIEHGFIMYYLKHY